MLVRTKFLVAAVVVCALMAVQASAATVTMTMWLNQDGPGTFNVYAESSGGDNFGIASYGVPIIGAVTSIDHKSPSTLFATTPGFGPAGFSQLRSPDGAQLLSGSQDTVTPTPNLVKGFGQQASSFAAKGITPGAPAEQPVWGVPLLLASGTYDRAQGDLDFGRTSVDLFTNVFAQDGQGNQTMSADLVLRVIPEPASIALIGLALVGCVGWVRRRK